MYIVIAPVCSIFQKTNLQLHQLVLRLCVYTGCVQVVRPCLVSALSPTHNHCSYMHTGKETWTIDMFSHSVTTIHSVWVKYKHYIDWNKSLSVVRRPWGEQLKNAFSFDMLLFHVCVCVWDPLPRVFARCAVFHIRTFSHYWFQYSYHIKIS